MKKLIKVVLCAFMLLQVIPMQLNAQGAVEVDYFMRGGLRLEGTPYIFYTYGDNVYRYDFKTNTTIEKSSVLANNRRTSTALVNDIFYVGTNYTNIPDEQPNFNITGFSVDDLSVVYNCDFNFVQTSGQRFAVDANQNFYFTFEGNIVSYDCNGNMIDCLAYTNPIELKQIVVDKNILIIDNGYEGYEGSIEIDNGYFVGNPKFGYGKLDSYYKFSPDEKYSIDQYGQVSLMSYSDDTGVNFGSFTYFDVDTNGISTAFSGDFDGDRAYVGDKHGNLYHYDLLRIKVLCEKNIGENKNILNVHVFDSKIYVFYIVDGSYYMEVYDKSDLEEYIPQQYFYTTHSTYQHTVDEIRTKYFALMNTIDYENYHLYKEEPHLENPYYEGVVKDEVIQDLLNQLNFFRWLSGVDEVELYEEGLPKYQKAAVIQYAINRDGLVDPDGVPLDHYPDQPSDMDDEFYMYASDGSSKANLSYGVSPAETILGYITDHKDCRYSKNPIGHRESLLDYKVFRASFGQIFGNDGIYYNATHVTDDDNKTNENLFSSWPVAGYMPNNLIEPDTFWSVTVDERISYLPEYGSKVTLIHEGIEYIVNDVNAESLMSICFKVPEDLLKKITSKNPYGLVEFTEGEEVTVKIEKLFNLREDEINITYSTRFMNLYDIYPDSIEFRYGNVQLEPNQTYQYQVNFNPIITTHYHLKWSSSDETIASIDENGKVTTHKPGTVTITAESENGLKATSTLKVMVFAQRIALEDIVIYQGDTVQMNVKVIPEDAEITGAKNWYTSNPEIAKINMYGEVTGVKPGVSEIRVEVSGLSATCTVTVLEEKVSVPITSVKLNKNSLNIEVGNTQTLTATILPNNTTDSKTVVWKSDNPGVASVDENGKVTGLAEGSTFITATTVNNKVATCIVTVSKSNKPRPTPTPTPDTATEVVRIKGQDRYKTSLEIADALKEELGVDKFDAVLLANGRDFADALAGSYLAAVKDAPILMVDSKFNNMTSIINYLNDNMKPDGEVYILGGEVAVPGWAETALTEAGYSYERLKGSNRYGTNLKILEKAGVSNEPILVCYGKNFADSLSASATGLPLLLVGSNLNAEQKAFLEAHRGNPIYVLGGEAAVSTNIENALKDYGTVVRIKGTSRYETSIEIAKKFFSEAQTVVMGYAKNFPDGLCGGPLAYNMKAPLILTATNNGKAAEYTKSKGITSGAVLGGDTLISDDAVKNALGKYPVLK